MKPAALATTWKLPPAPRPWRLPLTLRLASLQVPVTSPPWATTLACEVELIGVAGAGQDHFHVGPADLVGGAATDALAGAIVERHGAAAGQLPAMPAKALDWAWPGDAAKPVIKKATAANVSRRVWANNCDVWLVLLTGRFPSTAAWDTS